MSKIGLYRVWVMIAALCICVQAVRAQYQLRILPVDKDSVFISQLKLQTSFKNSELAASYIQTLPDLLQSRGFIAASVDSVTLDTLQAVVNLYVGDAFKWAQLNTSQINKAWLEAI